MKEFHFVRKAIYREYGFVTAKTEEEAIEMINNNDYDDIFDTSWDSAVENSLQIEDVYPCDDEQEEEEM